MKILGIESSCDETAAAIVEDGKTILSNVVASSVEMHIKYGGVVPEVAARKQVEAIIPVLTEAMSGFTKDDIDAIAVTVGPGLIGSLLVGVETAKTLAFIWNKPLIPINHVLAHMYAVFLEEKNNSELKIQNSKQIKFPAVSLVVSGGHTELYLMQNERDIKWLGGTLDDAAGEAFDKTARLLGLPYPGGPEIAAKAARFKVESLKFKVTFPRPMINDESFNFSFSGLKTAVLREWKKRQSMKPFDSAQGKQFNNVTIQQFAYEIQKAITDVLVTKTIRATEQYQAKSVIVSGGVAANQRLKEKFTAYGSQFAVVVPRAQLCVDSATYIAAYAYYQNKPQAWEDVTAVPDLSVEV
jgi:N6-L-threonylcarbamoyladenine synthase